MKKIALILVLIMSLMQISALAAEPYDYLHISGCDSWVSMRELPSRDSDRIAKVRLGALVTYIADANDEFIEVQFAGMRGYILRSYLSEGYFFDMYNVPMYVRPETANVYTTASVESDVVTTLNKGDMISVVSKIGGDDATMAHVRFDQTEGYMLMTDMTFFHDVSAPAVTDAVMIVPDSSAGLIYQPISCDSDSCAASDDQHHAFHMQEIAAMLDRAEPGITCQGPLGAQFMLKVADVEGEPRLLRFMMPLDGCPILVAENLITYQLTEADGKRLWQLFGDVWTGSYLYTN